jgi:hypothetical protein
VAAVAIATALLCALVAAATVHGGDRQFDQMLQAIAGKLRDQLPGCAAIQ